MTSARPSHPFDPHHRLLLAVLNLGGSYKFAHRVGRLLDHRPGRHAINPDLRRSLEMMGFKPNQTWVKLGLSEAFYEKVHEELLCWLRIKRLSLHAFGLFILRTSEDSPFALRVSDEEFRTFSQIILDKKHIPLWDEEDSS